MFYIFNFMKMLLLFGLNKFYIQYYTFTFELKISLSKYYILQFKKTTAQNH